jgi:ABC-type microcin C transport system duplicated ATPase subunit YejF
LGKSLSDKTVHKLIDLTVGEIRIRGRTDRPVVTPRDRPWRRRLQVVFRDPYFLLNPRFRIRDTSVAVPRIGHRNCAPGSAS